MRFLGIAGITIRHLLQSIQSQYGSGISSFFKYIYCSFLRVNTFVVFTCNGSNAVPPLTVFPQLRCERKAHEFLHNLRSSRALPREFYCDELAGVDDFFLGLWEEQPAYIHWVFPSGAKSRFLGLGEGCAEVGYMLTLPEYRGKKICSQVLKYTLNELRSDGLQRIFCVVHDQNVASIKAVQRAGFHEFTRIKSVGPFNTRLHVTHKITDTPGSTCTATK